MTNCGHTDDMNACFQCDACKAAIKRSTERAYAMLEADGTLAREAAEERAYERRAAGR